MPFICNKYYCISLFFYHIYTYLNITLISQAQGLWNIFLYYYHSTHLHVQCHKTETDRFQKAYLMFNSNNHYSLYPFSYQCTEQRRRTTLKVLLLCEISLRTSTWLLHLGEPGGLNPHLLPASALRGEGGCCLKLEGVTGLKAFSGHCASRLRILTSEWVPNYLKIFQGMTCFSSSGFPCNHPPAFTIGFPSDPSTQK